MDKIKEYKRIFEFKDLAQWDFLQLLIESLHHDIDEILDVILDDIVHSIRNKQQKVVSGHDTVGNYLLYYSKHLNKILPISKEQDILITVKHYERQVSFSGKFSSSENELTISALSLKNLESLKRTLNHELTHLLDELRYNKRVSKWLDSYDQKNKIPLKSIPFDIQYNIHHLIMGFSDPEIQAYVHVAVNYIKSVLHKDYGLDADSVLEGSGYLKIIRDAQKFIWEYPEYSSQMKLGKYAREGLKRFIRRLLRELPEELTDEQRIYLEQSIAQYYNDLSPRFK